MTECLLCRGECRSLTDRRGLKYHICGNCGFTFLDKAFRLTDEEEKARYDHHNNDSGNAGYIKWLTNFMEEAVLPFADEKARILDFGSGPVPVLAGLMERRGFAVSIYDKYYAPVVPEGSFDFITSTEVFEHLTEPMQTLLLLKKKLSPGAAISVKTLFRPESDEDFMNWWYREDRTHISFFTSRSFLIMAETAGLSIEFCDHRSIVILRN